MLGTDAFYRDPYVINISLESKIGWFNYDLPVFFKNFIFIHVFGLK